MNCQRHISVAGGNRQKKPAPAGGFSLIEVLMAVAIFSIGLLAVAGMQVSSTNKNASLRKHTVAVQYATEIMEKLIRLDMDADDLDADANPHALAAASDISNPSLDPDDYYDGLFDVSWTVTEGDIGDGTDNIKYITVTVDWPGASDAAGLTLTGAKIASL